MACSFATMLAARFKLIAWFQANMHWLHCEKRVLVISSDTSLAKTSNFFSTIDSNPFVGTAVFSVNVSSTTQQSLALALALRNKTVLKSFAWNKESVEAAITWRGNNVEALARTSVALHLTSAATFHLFTTDTVTLWHRIRAALSGCCCLSLPTVACGDNIWSILAMWLDVVYRLALKFNKVLVTIVVLDCSVFALVSADKFRLPVRTSFWRKITALDLAVILTAVATGLNINSALATKAQMTRANATLVAHSTHSSITRVLALPARSVRGGQTRKLLLVLTAFAAHDRTQGTAFWVFAGVANGRTRVHAVRVLLVAKISTTERDQAVISRVGDLATPTSKLRRNLLVLDVARRTSPRLVFGGGGATKSPVSNTVEIVDSVAAFA